MMYTETIKLESVITDIAAGPFGSNLKVSCFVDYGFPIIDGANLKGFKVTDNVTKFVTEEKARSLHRSIAKRNDVIVTISGTLGQIAYIPENSMFEEYLCSQRQFRVSFDTERVFVPYLVYYFHSREGQHKILSFANQTGVPALSQPLKNFRNIEVDLPDIDTQKQIASVMLSLDDKIELNTAINENLEQQAQALFKAWFVDFEPFGGVMPDDWTETTLGTIAAISTKSINPLKQPDLYLEHYSIPAYDEQHYPVFEYASEVKSNKYILTNNSVMISKLNPDTKRIWRPLCLSANPVCSTEFIVYESVNPKYKDYIYSLIDSQSFSDYLCAHTTGSTNSRQRATPKTTLDFPCVLPTDDTMSQFCGVVTPIYNQIGANLIENQRLAFLRDTLLPKLMNGEIDVSEVKI